jgi:hypothetical protein
MSCSRNPAPERRRAISRVAVAALALCGGAPAWARSLSDDAVPSAAQIVERHVAARGGLDAWRRVQTMLWVGHVESASAPAPSLPFALQMKRPDKERFELSLQSQRTVRAYDGHAGWKLRMGRDGKPEVQPYTEDELRFAREAPGIEQPLMGWQDKRVAFALEGLDPVEGREAYRLAVTLPSGARCQGRPRLARPAGRRRHGGRAQPQLRDIRRLADPDDDRDR